MRDDVAAAQLRHQVAKAASRLQPQDQLPKRAISTPMTAGSPPASEAQLAWAEPEVPIDETRVDLHLAAFRAQRQMTAQQCIEAQDLANRQQFTPEEWNAYLIRQSDEAVKARQRALPMVYSKPPGLPDPAQQSSSSTGPKAPPSPIVHQKRLFDDDSSDVDTDSTYE